MKKSVKKVLAAAIVLCLAFAMVACSGGKSNSKFVGSWKATSIEAMGMTISDPASMGFDAVFDFKADGNLELTLNGEKETAKWEEKDGGVEIKDSTQTVTGKMEGDKLVISMSQDGMDMKFSLEKQ